MGLEQEKMKQTTGLMLIAGGVLAAWGAYTVLRPHTLTDKLTRMHAGATAIAFASTLEHVPNIASLDATWEGVKVAYRERSFSQEVYDLLRELYLARGGVNP